TFANTYPHLDLLVNNAGVMGPPYTITQNNLELQFDANHIGHFYLTSLLFERLDQPFETRVISVTSLAARYPSADIHFDNLNFEGSYEDGPQLMGLKGMDAYAQSKLANLLFALELNERVSQAGKQIKSIVVHPGTSFTDLGRNAGPLIRLLLPLVFPFFNASRPADGARPALYAALNREVESGDFIAPTGKEERTGKPGRVPLPPKALENGLGDRLWTLSEQELGVPFAF
ncbi:MAG: SDR family NAD(P)-dependent oxidoreductase, partial [Chloroflexota bacterium]